MGHTQFLFQGGKVHNQGSVNKSLVVTFQRAFTTTNYTICVTLIGGTSGWNDSGIVGVWFQAWNRTTTSFTTGSHTAQNLQNNYYACGY